MICLLRVEKIENFIRKNEIILKEMDYMVIVSLIIVVGVLFMVMMILAVTMYAHCSMI